MFLRYLMTIGVTLAAAYYANDKLGITSKHVKDVVKKYRIKP